MGEDERPTLPDYPMFAKGPVRADKEGVYIWANDAFGSDAMLVQCRGWGYLTGRGKALALDPDSACDAQIKTLKFIADAINEKLEREGFLTRPRDTEKEERE